MLSAKKSNTQELFIMHSVGSFDALDSILDNKFIGSLDYLKNENIIPVNNNTYKVDTEFHLDKFAFGHIVTKEEMTTYFDSYNIIIPYHQVKDQIYNIGYDLADIITHMFEKRDNELSLLDFSIYEIGQTSHVKLLSHLLDGCRGYIYLYRNKIIKIVQEISEDLFINLLNKLLIDKMNKSDKELYNEFLIFMKIILIYIDSQMTTKYFKNAQQYRRYINQRFKINDKDMGIECRFLNYLDLSNINYRIICKDNYLIA